MKHSITAALLFLSFPLFAFAGSYTPIVGIPGVSGDDFEAYMNSIYALSITVAALLAVIKIVIAGVKWMVTDVVTTKGEAKKDIQGALLGLLVILSAVLILSVINTDIVGGNITDNQTQQTPNSVTAPGGYTLTITPTTVVDSGGSPLYESIPGDASASNQIAFSIACGSPRSSVRQVVTGDTRCYNTTAAQPNVRWGIICNGRQVSRGGACANGEADFIANCSGTAEEDPGGTPDGGRAYVCIY